jgi:hypothetical protein
MQDSRKLTTRQTALAIFVLTFLIYLFPIAYDLLHKPFFGWAGHDTASATLLPLALLERGEFTLDEFQEFARKDYRDPYFLVEVNGRIVSRYPVSAAILATPFYGIPLGTGWIENPGRAWLTFPWSAFFPAKFAAAFITALAVVMFFFCARELSDLKTSAAIALAFALATSIWSTVSQGLWQHTPSILFQTIGIWFILRGRRAGANDVAPAAFFFSAATISRQNVAFTALLFTLYTLIEHRSAILRWLFWAIPPALFALIYNSIYNGSPFVFGYQEGLTQTMSAPRLDSFLGLLISPSRGLLIYSPFFIFALASLWLIRREEHRRFYSFAALAFGIGALFLSTFQVWDGGWGYGTRLMTDLLPYAALLLIPPLVRLRGARHLVFWTMVAYGVLLQSLGLWDYGARWHWHWDQWVYDVWDIRENEPLFYLKEHAAMAEHYIRVYLLRR